METLGEPFGIRNKFSEEPFEGPAAPPWCVPAYLGLGSEAVSGVLVQAIY